MSAKIYGVKKKMAGKVMAGKVMAELSEEIAKMVDSNETKVKG